MNLSDQVITLRSVLISMGAIQLATAASGTLVPLAFSEIGATQEAASLAASAYSAGFMIGCFFVARFISDIGHIRAFAAGAAIMTSAALLFSLMSDASALIILRFLTGLATAGLFSIGDAWINERAEESSRGRILAIYAIVVGVVSVFSQVLVVLVPDDISSSFVLVALVYCFSIIVIATTRTDPPDTEAKASVRLWSLTKDAPAAAVGVFAIGMVSTTLLSVAPYDAAQLGVAVHEVAIIIGTIYLGRVLFQYPLGSLSDQMDRRIVIFFASLVATSVLLLMALLVDPSPQIERFDYLSLGFFILFVLMLMLGGSLLPLYSLLVAHALDRTVPSLVSSAAVSMLFIWTLGAVAGPLVANLFTTPFGDDALHWVNFFIMLVYVVFLGIRIWFVEPVSGAERTTHVEVIPTSTEIALPEKS
ncbi:MAG: MFS transporter [Rhizobiaceae bacterium]